MFYLYAISDPCINWPALPPGIEDIVPDTIMLDGFNAIAGRISHIPMRDTGAVRSHWQVLAALMPHATILPAQFGSIFQTRDELAQTLTERKDRLLSELQRLSGCIELGVSVTNRGTQISPKDYEATSPLNNDENRPGTQYLALKHAKNKLYLQRERDNNRLSEKLCGTTGPLTKLVTQTSWRALSSSTLPTISAAFLLSSNRLDAFLDALDDLRHAEPDLDFLCTGPWPPFSFVNADIFS